MEVSKLSTEEKMNVLAATSDPKFKSLLKLFENQKTTFLKIVAFGKVPEDKKKVYQGGAMMITAIMTALEAEAIGAMNKNIDDDMKRAGLDVVGW